MNDPFVIDRAQSMILVIEDEEEMRQIISYMLRHQGWQVVEAVDGQDGFDRFQADSPDLLLVDLNMPRMDGFALCRAVRAHTQGGAIPILVITGLAHDEQIDAAFAAGADDYLIKPFRSHLLFHRISHMLTASRAQQRLLRQQAELESLVAERTRSLEETVQRLQESEALQRVLLNAPGMRTILFDRQGRILAVNQNMAAGFGRTPEEMHGQDWRDLPMPPDILENRLKWAERAFQFNVPVTFEDQRDGRYFRTHLFPVSEAYGTQVMAGYIIDISEQKQIHTQLSILFSAVEQSPATVIVTDQDGDIVYVNRKFVETTGYSASEVMGQNPRLLKSGRQAPAFYSTLWTTIKQGRQWRGEMINRRKDGTLYWERALISPMRREDGSISHFIAVKEDITEQIHFQNQAIHEARLASLGMLSANVAHEINNPNNAIRFNAALVQEVWEDTLPILDRYAQTMGEFTLAGLDYSELRGLMSDHLAQMLANSDRITRIIANLKRLSRNESGDMDHEVEIMRLLEQSITLLYQRFEKQGVALEWEPAAWEIFVRGNALQLEQVLLNILQNALEALTDHPVGSGEIRVVVTMVEERVTLAVSDNGPGIERERMDKVFDAFTTSKKEGTGLGLAIARTIVKNHRGELVMTLNPGAGVTVSVTLPVSRWE